MYLYSLKLEKETRLPVLVKERFVKGRNNAFNSPDKIAKLINDVFDAKNLAEEHMYMLAMSSSHKILGIFEVSHGGANYSLCNPREIMIRALLCGATEVVLIHNHPSGNIAPSKDDIQTVQRIGEAMDVVGIFFLDFIIIGDSYFSMSEGKGVKWR